MTDSAIANPPSYDHWSMAKCLDDCAKWWWGASLITKCLAFLIGAVAVLAKADATVVPFAVAALGIAAEAANFRSDGIRGIAQGLRRKLDLQDSFGWKMSNAEYADLVVRSPASVKNAACATADSSAYFASTQLPGPRRAVENVMESSWWSKHLSEQMGKLCLSVLVLANLLSITLLLLSILAATPTGQLSAIARIITSFLMLMISLGLVKLMTGYFGFSHKASRVDEAAERLLQRADIELVEALKLISDYHVARASSPVIPTTFWKRREKELNQTWKAHRLSQSEAAKTGT